jgi:hypothetical protein
MLHPSKLWLLRGVNTASLARLWHMDAVSLHASVTMLCWRCASRCDINVMTSNRNIFDLLQCLARFASLPAWTSCLVACRWHFVQSAKQPQPTNSLAFCSQSTMRLVPCCPDCHGHSSLPASVAHWCAIIPWPPAANIMSTTTNVLHNPVSAGAGKHGPHDQGHDGQEPHDAHDPVSCHDSLKGAAGSVCTTRSPGFTGVPAHSTACTVLHMHMPRMQHRTVRLTLPTRPPYNMHVACSCCVMPLVPAQAHTLPLA